MEESSLNVSIGSSPTQASRIEKAIRRYEEEIQTICRSGAQLRASYQTKSTSNPSDLPREDSDSMRKLLLRVQGLEDYVQTLEGKLRETAARRSFKPVETIEIDSQPSISHFLSENTQQRSEIESLRHALKQNDGKSTRLQAELAEVRGELALLTQENTRLANNYRNLEGRYRLLRDEYEGLSKSKESFVLPERAKELEEELEKYREQVRLRDQENARMVRKMHEFVRESEEMQGKLRRRIDDLEAEQRPVRNSDSRPRLDRSELEERRHHSISTHHIRRSKDSRSSVSSYPKPTAPRRKGRSFADSEHLCDRCGRHKSKERSPMY